jgi:hypothetical protein
VIGFVGAVRAIALCKFFCNSLHQHIRVGKAIAFQL